MNDMAPTGFPSSLRARCVFPVSGPPLKDAAVTIADGRIVAVGNEPTDGPIEDLGDVALVPGLVNAHTHLEFSDVARPIGNPKAGLVAWLRSVIEHRALQSPANPTEAGPASAVAQGLAECLRCGVTTIGEIAQPHGIDDVYNAAPCGGTHFVEMIAPRLERVDAALEAARACLNRINLPSPSGRRAGGEDNDRWHNGLSPHAPYTVHPQLLVRAAALSVEHDIPLAMHLAESREELEFLRDGSGPFRELLESRRGFDPSARPRGSRPLDELRCLSQASRALVIHGNYLDDEEIEFVANHHRNMAVIYCPRTHTWFGHDPYPLEKLLAAGAVVALGTDSRASSPDLSLLAEMRHVARSFPSLSRATILELGTLGGAKALGREAEIGTLKPGNWANFTAIRLPDDPKANPHELLIDCDGEVAGTWVRGNRCN
jgi:cytosine/adenosine deaminase-related metal-dependent hydrolase